MNSSLQVLVEVRPARPPASESREHAWFEEACWDQHPQHRNEDPLEDFVDGSGI